MFVAGVRRLERIILRVHAEGDVDDILEFDIGGARPHIDAVTGVMTHAVHRNAAQGMVERVDAAHRPFAAFGDAFSRVQHVMHRKARIVDLQQETRFDDGEIFFAHGVRDGEEAFVIIAVETVFLIALEARGRGGRHEDIDMRRVFKRRFQIGDVAPNGFPSGIGNRPCGRHARRRSAGMAMFVEFRKGFALARIQLRRGTRYRLQPGEAFGDIGDEAGFRLFAVVDDVDATGGLLPDNVGHRLRHGVVIGGPGFSFGHHFRQRIAAGEAAHMGGENAFAAFVHQRHAGAFCEASDHQTKKPIKNWQKRAPTIVMEKPQISI